MADKGLYLTAEGLEKLKAELDDLINHKRPEVVEQIKRARELGDLSENSLYDQARANQSFVEGRIQELESVVEQAKIIADETPKDEVGLGSQVIVHIDGDEESFTIVGEPEADPSNAKISHTSPLGQALMGKKIGDEVKVEAPVGEITYRIMKIG
jgi:transcription elongation factor GreA